MAKGVVRILLTILMYSGVAVFLFPYFSGRVTQDVYFIVAGAGLAVVCGLLRCYLTEGDCTEPIIVPQQHLTSSSNSQERLGSRKR